MLVNSSRPPPPFRRAHTLTCTHTFALFNKRLRAVSSPVSTTCVLKESCGRRCFQPGIISHQAGADICILMLFNGHFLKSAALRLKAQCVCWRGEGGVNILVINPALSRRLRDHVSKCIAGGRLSGRSPGGRRRGRGGRGSAGLQAQRVSEPITGNNNITRYT